MMNGIWRNVNQEIPVATSPNNKQFFPSSLSEETLVCATDAGGAKRTRKMADELQAGVFLFLRGDAQVGGIGVGLTKRIWGICGVEVWRFITGVELEHSY